MGTHGICGQCGEQVWEYRRTARGSSSSYTYLHATTSIVFSQPVYCIRIGNGENFSLVLTNTLTCMCFFGE